MSARSATLPVASKSTRTDDVERAKHLVEWARATGVALSRVAVNGVTLDIAGAATLEAPARKPTSILAMGDADARMAIYRQFAGEALDRVIDEPDAVDHDDDVPALGGAGG